MSVNKLPLPNLSRSEMAFQEASLHIVHVLVYIEYVSFLYCCESVSSVHIHLPSLAENMVCWLHAPVALHVQYVTRPVELEEGDQMNSSNVPSAELQ